MKNVLTILIVALSIITFYNTSYSQAPAKKTASQKVTEYTDKAAEKIDKTKEGIKQVSEHVKSIVRIFEPFFRRKDDAGTSSTNSSSTVITEGQGTTTESNQTVDPSTNPASSTSNYPNYTNTSNYNAEGIANLGTQNSKDYGNYIDIGNGMIYDDIDAATASGNIDLIFTATNWAGKTLYAFFSPYFAKNNTRSRLYNYGIKFKRNDPHPASQWQHINESEVALTNLTGKQFEKITNNTQLEAVIKGTQKFSGSLEITDGVLQDKVIAVKTVMGDRVCYGLLYFINQYGTTGENSYAQVKLKVTGFDSNGDGLPDAPLYNQ